LDIEQEPILDDSGYRNCREVAETMAVLDEFNKINDSFVAPVYENADKMEQLMDRQALLQEN
jgi:hypothetical protein